MIGGVTRIVIIKPTKFVMAFTLGSLLFMMGFAVLQGPMNRAYVYSLTRQLVLLQLDRLLDVMFTHARASFVFSDLKHIFSPERLPFSLTYFGSLALTIYFAVG